MTAVLFGILPALAVRRVDLRSSIASHSVAGGERLRIRQVLIAGEVALTVLLLAGSGLLIRTLIHLETLPPGFNPNGVMAAKASLDDAHYHDPATFQQLLTTSVAAMQRIPGVRNAAMGLSLPFERVLNDGSGAPQRSAGRKDGRHRRGLRNPGLFRHSRSAISGGPRFHRCRPIRIRSRSPS